MLSSKTNMNQARRCCQSKRVANMPLTRVYRTVPDGPTSLDTGSEALHSVLESRHDKKQEYHSKELRRIRRRSTGG